MENTPTSPAPAPLTMPPPESLALNAPTSVRAFDRPPEVRGESKKTDIPHGFWTRCDGCGEMITRKELEEQLKVCPKCQRHFTAGARERITWLVDDGSFSEIDAGLTPVDALGFKGAVSYAEKLKSNQKKTGLHDVVISGFATVEGRKLGLAVMDFSFLGGSMGSVAGEKITRLIEGATRRKLPAVVICASGGARMYEGMLSLMQMAKTCAAVATHARAGLPYIVVLTNPTMAGVMASFASVGDIILAEPESMIGFAGARVIRETTGEELPKGFQTAEFLLEHGLVDMIVHRRNMRPTLARLLGFMA